MTELVARLHGNAAGVKMHVVMERLTWPLRKLAWLIEERLIWPVADLLRRSPRTPRVNSPAETVAVIEPEPVEIAPELTTGPTGWPASAGAPADSPAATGDREPLLSRLSIPIREISIVLGTIAVAVGVGVGVATLLGGSDSAPKISSSHPASAQQASAAVPGAPSGPATLEGVAPNFKGSQQATPGSTAAKTQASPLANTNSKPSSIPPGVADNISAIQTARTFSGAFVLYEIGQTDAQVRKTFRATATPALARALEDRPPRLPGSVDVPTAKVQNIVLGTEKGKQVDASVSLLRLGATSELRLTLTRDKDGWAVSEVRG
jgi:hypothetical protein